MLKNELRTNELGTYNFCEILQKVTTKISSYRSLELKSF